MAAPLVPYVLFGQSNLDPYDGEGRAYAIRALLANPALQDTQPRGTAQRQDAGQSGDAAMDTALYPKLGGLRVEQVLPSADLRVAVSYTHLDVYKRQALVCGAVFRQHTHHLSTEAVAGFGGS